VKLAQPHSLFLFDLGYFKLAAFAKIAAAQAYFLSRFNHQTALREVVGGRPQPLDLPQCLRQDSRALVEKAVILGTRDCVAARLIAIRMPEAIVNERRRQAYAAAKKRGYTPSQQHLTLMAWNLFITNVPATVWPPKTVAIAYSLRWQVEVCQSQPVKMSWCPLRVLVTIIIYLRGVGKREDIVDVDLLSGNHDFFDQALHDRLAIGKGKAIEILA